ncbi:hypothetical protein [Dokdonia sp.]|uniref:hypothetical protein n=1 Tax=Dokdonia sp. TaxID=2024995 RepID=UPI003262CD43
MKNILILFLLFANLSFAQQNNIDNDKELALTLCEEFTKKYSKNNSYTYNQRVYIKNIKIKLDSYKPKKGESILRKLHALCPSFLEYSTISSKMVATSKGRPNAYKLWDNFINSTNNISWTENEKNQFLYICNYALSEKKNSKQLCECTIEKISQKLKADYFLNLSTSEQGYLGGQVSYIYCSE